ncbi:MAG: hypothetical protein KDI71_07410 [Xanthomonadales bacterium]|nr:hypothetical protein [Xanthomonadales bacterium]
MSAAPHFEQALSAARERYNQQFKLAQASRPNLDPQAFGSSLREWVAPLVEAVAKNDAARVEIVTAELYEVALALLLGGQRPNPEHPRLIDQLWTQLLPQMAASVAQAPRRLCGALSNAVLYLERHRGRGSQWLEGMVEIHAELTHPGQIDVLLRAGQVLAWRAGVAAFRAAALTQAAQLPPRILAACLGWPSTDREVLNDILARLRDDPWAEPLPAFGPPRLVEVGQVGGFSGLGGYFTSLPIALFDRGRIRLVDADNEYALCADSCGAQLVADGELPVLQQPRSEEDLRVDKRTLKHVPSGSRLQLPGSVRSWSFDGHTAAICLDSSYWVRLYACKPQLEG